MKQGLKKIFVDTAKRNPKSGIAKRVFHVRFQTLRETRELIKNIEIELAWLTREPITGYNEGQKKAFYKVLNFLRKGGE